MIYERKVKINNMINNIKDKSILKEIFQLVHVELNSTGECRYTYNNNGIFFDLNILSDNTLIKIEEILNNSIHDTEESESIKYSMYSAEDMITQTTESLKNTNDYKLSNKEKNLMNNIKKS